MNSQSTRTNMIKQQLQTGGVHHQTILELYNDIPREAFVPSQFNPFAYSDLQIPLNHQQRMMTPLEEALVLQSLDLKGSEVILEVGTGTGFLTALLSRQCKKVISIDYYADFTTEATKKLKEHQCNNTELLTGDASKGWLDKAPYDVVILTGAIECLNETLRLQVLPGGQLFAIVGIDPVMQGQLHRLDHDGQWQMDVIFETQLPPLIDALKPNDFVF